MALPEYFLVESGTVKSWANTGVNYQIWIPSIADQAGGIGAKGDLGQYWANRWLVKFESAVGSAATAGKEIELYWGPSDSSGLNNNNPGNLTGVSGAWPSASEYKAQCLFVGSLVLSNNAGTSLQRQYFEFYPPARYGCPAVFNNTGQTLHTTQANHSIMFTPVFDGVYDTNGG